MQYQSGEVFRPYQFHLPIRGNRFWKVIHQAGTDRLLKPRRNFSCWILAGDPPCSSGPTVQASEVELLSLRRWPGAGQENGRVSAACWRSGKQAFEKAFQARGVKWGKQQVTIGATEVWVLPNPSGLNRATLDKLVEAYRELDEALATRGL